MGATPEEKIHRDLLKKLARKYGKDRRVIDQIVQSPFLLARKVISDNIDPRPIRLRYFGIIALKRPTSKIDRIEKRIEILKERMEQTMVIMDSMGYMIKGPESVNRILDEAWETKDFDKLEEIWDSHCKVMYTLNKWRKKKKD